jgi:hypothetical protein
MKKPVVVIGIGEMGAVFARGFLRIGHPVFPVPRDIDANEAVDVYPDPEMVLVAVAEKDIHRTLENMPVAWKEKVCLLQNELLPGDWEGYSDPTVISVWFEKKKGQDSKVIIPSPAHGPRAQLLADALGSIDIPIKILDTPEQLLFELVVKNLYILTSNIAGLRTEGTVGELWNKHQTFARGVADDVIDIQEALTGEIFNREALIQAMVHAFEGDTEHKCMGRSAPARLARAIENADRLKLDVATLRSIRKDL